MDKRLPIMSSDRFMSPTSSTCRLCGVERTSGVSRGFWLSVRMKVVPTDQFLLRAYSPRKPQMVLLKEPDWLRG